MAAIYPDCLWKMPHIDKELYLTFDDGPTPEITPWVLDCLKQYEAKATFFCIGKNVAQHPEIVQRILAEGHSLGNHTQNHLNGWMTNQQIYFDDIAQCDETLLNFARQERALFRPPYGKLTPAQYIHLKNKYRIVMWDVLSFDFDLKIAEDKVLSNVLNYAEPGSIIVMHDSLKAMDKVRCALPQILAHFTPLGYQFKAL